MDAQRSPPSPCARKATLVLARNLSPVVRSLVFDVGPAAGFLYAPGQWVEIAVSREHPRRAYCLACAQDPDRPQRFEVAVTRVEGGSTSAALHALQVGAEVEVRPPRGAFLRREPLDRPVVFVATGAGVAPLRAMLMQELRKASGPPLALLFGCRTEGDILWGDELYEWEQIFPRLRLEVTLSRASVGWRGRRGRVQEHLDELITGVTDAEVYVAGVSAMVDDVVARLRSDLRVPRCAIHHETYD